MNRLRRPIDLDWIRSLRKAELHLHLLGAIRPETALDLAQRHNFRFPVDRIEDWVPYFTSGGLRVFVEAFVGLFEIVRTGEDFERVAREVFEDLAADGIFYVEPRVTLTSHLSRGIDRDAIIEGLTQATEYALRELGLAVGWIVDYPRILGPKVADLALEEAIGGREWGVVGFDVAGYEPSSRPDPHFETLFRRARDAGLGTTAHAGEVGSAENVRYALEKLEVDRIGHGIRAIDDPGLVQDLARKKIPLEISPTSNLALKGVDRLENHPLEQLRLAGVPITLNTDDPTLFGVSLSEELRRTALAFRWNRETVAQIVENGWKYRFRRDLPITPSGS